MKRADLKKALFSRIDKAVWEYRMFASGDRVLVAVSGGADSMLLLQLLRERLPVYGSDILLRAVYVDMGFADAAEQRIATIKDYWRQLGVAGKIVRSRIGPYAHSEENRENPCFLCARIRRKQIFAAADSFGCNKIVFGHHQDDLVATLLLNMIFGREISTSPPKLRVMGGKYHVLRPLIFVEETLIKTIYQQLSIPTFSQQCPSDGTSKRQYIKDLLDQLEADFPGTRLNLFNSMKRVKKDYLL